MYMKRKKKIHIKVLLGVIVIMLMGALYLCNKASKPKEITYKVWRED